jgi:alpha-L-fucosidase
VISHSLAGASQAYIERYLDELPRTFDPAKFDPDEWARMAKVAGVQYVVFTTKHHNGFAMWDTDTTEFNVTNTPHGEDIVDEVVDAFRAHDIAVGFYFSPDDFWLLHQQGKEISRHRDEVLPRNNPELMEHNKAQIRELFSEYGQIDTLFIDGDPTEIRELAWELQPEVVITRGAMETPEQELRDEPSNEPWESCMTMGTQWNYKPANEEYKSSMKLIETFVETRAKGGNLLLNVGPRPDGTIPREQEDRLRTLGLWNFVNREAVFGNATARPLREGNVWFTRASDQEPTTVYATLAGVQWPKDPKPRTVTLESVRATDDTEVGILGQSGRVFEYEPELEPASTWTQDDQRLHVTLTHAQRLYNADSGRLYETEPDFVKWPYPVVLEITNAHLRNE